MTMINHRYFIVTSPRADEIKQRGLAKLKESNDKRVELVKELNAHSVPYYTGRAPHAVVFKEEHPSSRPGFLRPERHIEDGATYWAYKPDMRMKAGKAIKEKLKSVGGFEFSEFILTSFGVQHMTIGACAESRTGIAMFRSVAGLIDGTIVIKIPFGGDGNAHEVSIPDDFIELKESDFVAISKEGKKIAEVIGVEA